MTGKDYESIAKAVNSTLEYWRKEHARGSPSVPVAHTDIVLGTLTVALIQTLYNDNPFFDGKRFHDACGVT